MNKILNKKTSLILLIVWLAVIFVFSNMNGDRSSDLSKNFILSILGDSTFSKDSFDIVHLIVRKLAHIIEYFILCILTYNYLRFYIHKEKYLYLLSLLFCFICSSLDEVHQLVVNGRSGKITDIFIDGLGIVLSLIVINVCIKNAAKRKSD